MNLATRHCNNELKGDWVRKKWAERTWLDHSSYETRSLFCNDNILLVWTSKHGCMVNFLPCTHHTAA